MKKTLVFAAFLAVSAMAHAENLRVHLSSDFATTGTLLPAGDYTVSRASGTSGIMLMQGNGLKAFVFGRLVTTGAIPTKTFLELSKDKSMELKSAPIRLALSPATP